MIPFPIISKYNNKGTVGVLLDIDFSRQAIGSTDIVDHSNLSTFTLKNGTPAEVVYDSDIGSNVMLFSSLSKTVYSTGLVAGSVLDLRNKNFTIEFEFRQVGTVVESVFGTGDYPGARMAGFSFTLNQFPSTYMQYFIDTGIGSGFNRVLTPGTNSNVWENLTLTYISTATDTLPRGISTYRELTNTTTTFPYYSFGLGQAFYIGGSYLALGQFNFNGYIKRLKITEIL